MSALAGVGMALVAAMCYFFCVVVAANFRKLDDPLVGMCGLLLFGGVGTLALWVALRLF